MKHLLIISLSFFLVFAFYGCSESKNDSDKNPSTALSQPTTCLGCHSSEAILKMVADPNPPPAAGEGGCGGTLPEMKAWNKVFIGGTNAQKFLNSSHGKLKCIACHGGVEPAIDKTTAHTGNFNSSPSKNAAVNCGSCHPSIASKDTASLHTHGFGQKYMVALRSNFAGYENYPEQLKIGYDKNCGKCHSSCGECHIMRPRQAGGGFLAAHTFQKQPDMRLNCTACHSARVAHAYFGEGFGTRPDVHYLKLPGGQCTNCHSADEMHGNGTIYTQRYKYPKKPTCEICHAEKATANPYHIRHWNDLACQICHSQEYQNCGSCHVDTGVRNGPYMGFKIGSNTMPEIKRFKFVVVRNAPYAPDTWNNYGVSLAVNFDVAPTFKLASPHNIMRWTPRTEVETGKPCFNACHIIDGRNKQWYLFKNDLKSWEVAANQTVVVDGKLPVSWK